MKRRTLFAAILAAPVALFTKAAALPKIGITVVDGRLPPDSIEKLQRFRDKFIKPKIVRMPVNFRYDRNVKPRALIMDEAWWRNIARVNGIDPGPEV